MIPSFVTFHDEILYFNENYNMQQRNYSFAKQFSEFCRGLNYYKNDLKNNEKGFVNQKFGYERARAFKIFGYL